MTDFDDALDELRFEDAAALLGPDDGERRATLHRRRDEAIARARALHDRVLELGHRHGYGELLAVARDPDTTRLLPLLSDAQRHRVELQLSQASRWGETQRRIARRRLAEAGRALERLDVELARGLLARIDGRHLGPDLAEEHDALLLAVAARSMEVEELSDAAERVVDEVGLPPPPDRRRRWWRRDG